MSTENLAASQLVEPGAQFVGLGIPMTDQDIYAAAREIDVLPIDIKTVLAVETNGRGFDAKKRPIILYEPHVAFRVCADDKVLQAKLVSAGLAYQAWGTKPYPVGQDAQYLRLDQAVALVGMERAVKACSWGLAQILGENYAEAGYKSATDMVLDCMVSEKTQLMQMMKLLQKRNLVAPLANHAWYNIALGWNGSGNARAYTIKLSQAYTMLLRSSALPAPMQSRVSTTSAPITSLHPANRADTSADALTAKWAADNGLSLSDP